YNNRVQKYVIFWWNIEILKKISDLWRIQCPIIYRVCHGVAILLVDFFNLPMAVSHADYDSRMSPPTMEE
ncbi:MAG: hypothetical protein OEW48_13190, partial [Phycisphaerae bacterium]|nr:hypothetical protein [Phycisphaerae bacterium]